MPMQEPTASLMTGNPLFADAELSRTAAVHGGEAAWRQAFETGGPAAAAAAQGHFSAALAKDDGDCFLAVDRFATRSLCYRVSEGQLKFAEQASDLADTSTPIDPQALFDYLYHHAIPSPRTVFKGVHRLPPGHCASFEAGRLNVQRYWTPRFEEQPFVSFKAARDEFRRVLADAVARQLDGSTPAAFLSGGTDSSTVAGLIGQVSGRPAETYSIGFEAEGYDEMEYARLAARAFGTRHHEYYVTPDDLVRSIPEVAAHHDQPFGNSSALPGYYCALRAREDGITHLLAGDGGDELFGGNTRYATQRVFGWYDRIPGALREGLIEPLITTGAFDRIPLLRKGASYVRQARVPLPDRMQTYNLLHRLGTEDMLTKAFVAQINVAGPQDQERQVWAQAAGSSLVNQMLAYDWRYTLAENDLPKVRSSTALAGVSVAYPFLDHAVLDFSLRMPTHFKLRGLKLRWFFKEALRGFLPDEIITKKKHGFGLPFGVWATRHAGLQALARDSLRSFASRGVVQTTFIDTLLDKRLPEHPGFYGEMVWILMMLEQWLRHHRPDWKLEA